MRVEDIDPPREQPGATELILTALENYGFEWDGPVLYQSASRAAHDTAIETLVAANQAYRCGCSRRDLATATRSSLGVIYPGTCREGSDADAAAIRVRTTNEPLDFIDRLQSTQTQRLESESGDFIILRRDGLIAYQLAVVVDDFQQGITDVVRGIDLMDSTPRQIWLQDLLGYAHPDYTHIPVAINTRGQKLSKSFGAGPVPLQHCAETLVTALVALGQQPPSELRSAHLDDIWDWAQAHWNIDVLRGQTQISPTLYAGVEPENGLS